MKIKINMYITYIKINTILYHFERYHDNKNIIIKIIIVN